MLHCKHMLEVEENEGLESEIIHVTYSEAIFHWWSSSFEACIYLSWTHLVKYEI